MTERLHPDLQPGDVAVVVGAPDVDEQLVAAGELVPVVGDVREQVGGLAVGLHDDAVLVVAEVGGAQPHGAVLLEDDAVLAQVGQRGVDRAGVVEALLAEPRVERRRRCRARLSLRSCLTRS